MDHNHSRSNVWPFRQYDGGDRYEECVVDKDTWIIEKGFKKHLGVRDPSSISRCRESYTVRTDTDPRGKRGTRVRDEQIKTLTEKVKLRESQMKTAANRVESYGVAFDLGYSVDNL